jgi:hypothetical protein
LPLLPPDLTQPFPNETERTKARNLLGQRDHALRALEELARKPAAQWSRTELASLPQTTNGVPDPPPARLARWATIFSDELGEVHRTANRRLLSDIELRQALYLAGRLLATVTGRSIDDTDYVSPAH